MKADFLLKPKKQIFMSREIISLNCPICNRPVTLLETTIATATDGALYDSWTGNIVKATCGHHVVFDKDSKQVIFGPTDMNVIKQQYIVTEVGKLPYNHRQFVSDVNKINNFEKI